MTDSHSDEVRPVSLRLAFLTELYYPHVGGQEVFFQGMAEAMVRRGHSVDLFCIGDPPGCAANEMLNGVQIHRNPNGGRYRSPALPALRRNWSDIVRYSIAMRRLARTQQHDFYLLNQWPLMHAPVLPKRVRAISGVHWCEARGSWPFQVVQGRLPRMVGSNFAVSEAVGTAMGEQSGRQFTVLPSGIEVARYRSEERSQRSGVLYVGRLWPHKNMGLLIDAFELAAARGLVGDLVIAGEGPDREKIEKRALRSTVAPRIRVLGSIDETTKVELLSQAAVLGMPSKREGFPRVIAEAMASGLPVVTAKFPENGAVDVVEEYGAGIVCGTEPAEFADALLAAEAGSEAFSQAGLAGVASLDWPGIAQALEARILAVTGQ